LESLAGRSFTPDADETHERQPEGGTQITSQTPGDEEPTTATRGTITLTLSLDCCINNSMDPSVAAASGGWPGVTGRVAIVTGASRGIGEETARLLLESGAKVCVTGRDSGALQDCVGRLSAFGTVIGVSGDTADPDHRLETVTTTRERLGAVTILVNNAATNTQAGPLLKAATSAVAQTLNANLMAPIGWFQRVWGDIDAPAGAAVNISSVGALRVAAGTGAYNISKFGLEQLTRQLALEMGPSVRVNGVAPGLVPTRFSRALVRGDEKGLAEAHPLGRLGRPRDIANAVLFLLSDYAEWITGQVLVVDGGGTSLGGVDKRAQSNLEAFLAGGTQR
jgi:NAD(P)-dependent dehydrogenase (short-subunit alcohol dehydrogenase family)